MEKRITILIKEPGKNPRLAEIENTLKAMQEVVGGYIETVRLPTPCASAILICDEEGKQKHRQPNFTLGADVICGTAFFCGHKGDQFISINEHSKKAAMAILTVGREI